MSYYLDLTKKPIVSSAAWFNDSWQYRQRVDVTNPSGSNLTDFQVSLSIGTSALIAAGKMQTNCADIRITDSQGKVLPHWIEDNNPGCNQVTDTKIWVKVPSLPSSGGTIFFYYGNPSATDIQNGNTVFEFFDDFSGDLSQWLNVSSIPWTISAGALNITPASDNQYLVANKSIGASSIAIEARIKSNHATGNGHAGFIWHANTLTNTNHRNDQLYVRPHAYNTVTNIQPGYYGGSLSTFGSVTGLYNFNTWYNLKIEIPSSNSIKYYRDGINEANFANQQYQTNTYVGLVAHAGNNQQYDNFRVRKLASAEPTTSAAAEETSSGPIAYWKFDEGVGTSAYNSSRNKYNGILGNYSSTNPAWLSEDQCISGKCLSFNGTSTTGSYITAGIIPELGPATDITISAWINPKQTSSDYMEISSDSWSKYLFGIRSSSKNLTFIVRDVNSSQVASGDYTLPSLNTWYHVTGVASETQGFVKLYVNGNLVKANNTSFTIMKSSNQIFIGSVSSNSGSDYFPGYIDEVKIYAYARTPAQIAADYNAGKAHTSSSKGINVALGSNSKNSDAFSNGLVGYWKFDESAGTTLADSSGLGATAAITGSFNFAPGKFGNAFRAGIGTTNLVRNPSIETSTSGWSFWQATGTQTSTSAVFGTYSVLSTQTTASGYTAFSNGYVIPGITPTQGQTYTCSAYLKTDSVWAGKVGRFVIRESGGASGNQETDTNITYSANWTRYTTTRTIAQSDRTTLDCFATIDNAGINDGETIYIDGLQAELNSTATPYTDGSLGIGYTWTGTAHASASLRYQSYSSTPDSPSLTFGTNSFSLSAWVKVNDYLSLSGEQSLINKYSGGYDGWRLEFFNNHLIFYAGDGGSSFDSSFTSNYTFSNNNWHYITLTIDRPNSKANLFIDGNLDTSSAISATTDWDTTTALYFGKQSWSNIFSSATIDEVRLYNRALQPAEVSQLYNWAPGPVAYWNFEEGSGTTAFDRSGNSQNIGWSGTGSHWGLGKYGQAATFNGSNDALNLPINSLTKFGTHDFTVSFWAKPPAYQAGANNNLAGQYPHATVNGTWYFYRYDNSGVTVQFGIKGTNSVFVRSLSDVPSNTWSYITGVREGNNLKIYINGILNNTAVGASAEDISYQSNNFTPTIGNLGGGYPYGGSIDDFKIYNYARTPKQIVEDMNAGHPAGGSPVGSQIGYWKFDEGFGTTAYNSGSQGAVLNASIIGSTLPTSWTNNGKFGKAINFAGGADVNGGRISIPTNPAIDFKSGNDVTATFWIYRRTMTGNDTILIKNGGWGIHLPNNSVVFQNWGCGNSDDPTVNVTLPLNQWLHIGVVYTDSNRTENVYLNGKFVGSDAGTSCLASGSGSALYIGYLDWTNYQILDGMVDEVKVYNYALTDQEIALDYNNGRAIAMGAGTTGSSSQSYCIPGDTATCSPPVAEWNFEEGAGTVTNDTSGNGNNASWQGTLGNQWANSKSGLGKAGNFNGSNTYVSITNSSLLQNAPAMSLSFWFKASSFSGNNYAGLVSKTDRTNGWQIIHSWGTRNLYFENFVSGSNTGNAFSSNTQFQDNTWYHITLTGIGTTMTLYVNGILDKTFNMASALVQSTNNIWIGRSNAGTPYFNGLIDQVKFYNYIRTPAQIALDYNRGSPVGWWKFDECQGSVAYDSSGIGNTGSIVVGAGGTQTSLGTCSIGGTTAWGVGATGKFNASLNFDGVDDYVGISNHSSLQLTNNFSISLWFKPSNLTQSNKYLLGKNNDYAILWEYTDNTINLYTNGQTGTSPQAVSAMTINDTNWHHITYSYDGTTLKSFLDGKNSSTNTISFSCRTTTSPLTIGAANNTPAAVIAGQLDDVRIYNYALTATQVQTLYNNNASVRYGQ